MSRHINYDGIKSGTQIQTKLKESGKEKQSKQNQLDTDSGRRNRYKREIETQKGKTIHK